MEDKNVTFKLDFRVWSALNHLRADGEIDNMADAIREAIEEYLDRHYAWKKED